MEDREDGPAPSPAARSSNPYPQTWGPPTSYATRSDKIVCVMVGLPARGKSYIARRLSQVRVKSLAPEGKGVSKRVKVSYPGGDTILVKVDGEELLRVGPLFARIDPEGCAWTLDGRDLCLSLEKGEARAWAKLTLSGNA